MYYLQDIVNNNMYIWRMYYLQDIVNNNMYIWRMYYLQDIVNNNMYIWRMYYLQDIVNNNMYIWRMYYLQDIVNNNPPPPISDIRFPSWNKVGMLTAVIMEWNQNTRRENNYNNVSHLQKITKRLPTS